MTRGRDSSRVVAREALSCEMRTVFEADRFLDEKHRLRTQNANGGDEFLDGKSDASNL